MSQQESILFKVKYIAGSEEPARRLPELRSLVSDFLNQEKKHPPRPELKEFYRSELAYALHLVMEKNKDFSSSAAIIHLLMSFPPLGHLLILPFFAGTNLTVTAQETVFQILEVEEQLFLANLGLLVEQDLSTYFLNWAEKQIKTLRLKQNKHVASFIHSLVQENIPLAPLTKSVLLQSRFIKNMVTSLKEQEQIDNLSDIIKILSLIRSPALLETTNRHVASSSPAAQTEIIKSIMDLPGPYSRSFTKMLQNFIKGRDKGLLISAMMKLLSYDTERSLSDMVDMFLERKELRAPLTQLCLFLGKSDFDRFYQELPYKLQPEIHPLLFDLLLDFDPEGVLVLCASPLLNRQLSSKSLDTLQRYLKSTLVVEKNQIQRGKPSRSEKSFSKRQRKKKFDQENITRSELTDSLIKDSTYAGCKFESVILNKSFIKNTRFERCTFKRTSFIEANLYKCSFVHCTFIDCNFSEAFLDECDLLSTKFSRCSFRMSQLESLTGELLSFNNVNFHEARFFQSTLSQALFKGSSFTGAFFWEIILTGCDFINANLNYILIRMSSFPSTSFTACSVKGMGIKSVETEDPMIASRRERIFRKTLFERISAFAPPEKTLKIPQEDQTAVVNAWLSLRNIRSRKTSFLKHNARRLSLAKLRLTRQQKDFFELIPLMLHCSYYKSLSDPDRSSAPDCALSEYTPRPREIEKGKNLLPGLKIPLNSSNAKIIEGIYTIGSTGSVAQTSQSDLDYWLCADTAGWSRPEREALRAMLNNLSRWAWTTYNLDVHFFLQDRSRILDNDFEHIDGQSSGSAQGLLLKEEFYRTGLKITGKTPLWWVTTPKSSSEEYETIAQDIETMELSSQFFDFGYLGNISSGEYFGASLWQIVKAFENPFKSILKFGLLESYVRRIKRPLLCEVIKENIFQGFEDSLHVDPYTIMFQEVWNYYCTSVEKEALEILKLSFLQKTRLNLDELQNLLGMSSEDLYCADQLFDKGTSPLLKSGAINHLEFKHLLEIEQKVNAFIFKTYAKVQESMTQKEQIFIDPKDLHRLGRKLFAAFAPRENKVERLPYVLTSKDMRVFEELYFSSTLAREGEREWLIRGRQTDPFTYRSLLTEIKRGHDLTRELAWLVGNELFHPRIEIKTDITVSPLTKEDIGQLLLALYTFFPHKEIFERDIDEGLESERVLKAFLVLNLTLPRVTERIFQASIVYCTNWGEFFCKSMDVQVTSPVRPDQFISEHVNKALDRECRFAFFIPRGASCRKNLITSVDQP